MSDWQVVWLTDKVIRWLSLFLLLMQQIDNEVLDFLSLKCDAAPTQKNHFGLVCVKDIALS